METNEVWENVKDGTKKAAQTVAAVAVDIYEQSKKQINIMQVRGELRTTFLQLGELVYNENASNIPADEERTRLIEKICNLKAQIEQAKNSDSQVQPDKKECVKCGRMLEGDAVFCSGCGEKQ